VTTEWHRPTGNDPRFDLTDEEIESLKFLAEALQTPDSEFEGGEGVGAVRAFIDGQPVTVVILYRPAEGGSPTATDMMPMAVLVNDAVFDMLVPPPKEGEE
jgi:hypothetical protein